jgi:hypothetical protein
MKPSKSLLSEGLYKLRETKQGESPSVDVLRKHNGEKSFSKLLQQGPEITAPSSETISELNVHGEVSREGLEGTLMTALRKHLGDSEHEPHGQIHDRANTSDLHKTFPDFSALHSHALQLAAAHGKELEPQVEDAVIDLNRKGYETRSSGFGKSFDMQQIDGPFTLDKSTKEKLAAIGVEVGENSKEYDFMRAGPTGFKDYTFIRFRAEKPNLAAITEEWRRITTLIPDKGKPAESL